MSFFIKLPDENQYRSGCDIQHCIQSLWSADGDAEDANGDD